MAKQIRLTDCIEKENTLRLKWFVKNRERLEEIANAPLTRTVPEELKEEMRLGRISRFQNVDKKIVKPVVETRPFPQLATEDPRFYNVMKPVDPKLSNLLYSGAEVDGRKKYLNERMKILPENRYYFPETTSFEYGWKLSDPSKRALIEVSNFGHKVVIKEFYRKSGTGIDPEWHREPAKLSPTICGTI